MGFFSNALPSKFDQDVVVNFLLFLLSLSRTVWTVCISVRWQQFIKDGCDTGRIGLHRVANGIVTRGTGGSVCHRWGHLEIYGAGTDGPTTMSASYNVSRRALYLEDWPLANGISNCSYGSLHLWCRNLCLTMNASWCIKKGIRYLEDWPLGHGCIKLQLKSSSVGQNVRSDGECLLMYIPRRAFGYLEDWQLENGCIKLQLWKSSSFIQEYFGLYVMLHLHPTFLVPKTQCGNNLQHQRLMRGETKYWLCLGSIEAYRVYFRKQMMCVALSEMAVGCRPK